MKTCSDEQHTAYLATFFSPRPASRRIVRDGAVGVIELPTDVFHYSPDAGYEFEVAAMAAAGTGRRLLFVRIDYYDPQLRREAEPGSIDYCIPMAYDGASERERLCWTIPFGGAWSDTREEALLVFEEEWAEWLREVKEGLAFANPGGKSGAYLAFKGRALGPIDAFRK